MDQKETQEGLGWRLVMKGSTKTSENQNRFFNLIYPQYQLKLNFWALSDFGGCKDHIKQTTQVNNNNNPLL